MRALTVAGIGTVALVDFVLGGLTHLGDIIIMWIAVLQLALVLIGILYAQPQAATRSVDSATSLAAAIEHADVEGDQAQTE